MTKQQRRTRRRINLILSVVLLGVTALVVLVLLTNQDADQQSTRADVSETKAAAAQVERATTAADVIRFCAAAPDVCSDLGIITPPARAADPQQPSPVEGARGPAGPIGPAGPRGPAGTPGKTGAIGVRGNPGPTGPTGPTGTSGTPGTPGASGTSGADGVDGKDGTNGKDGKDSTVPGPTGPAPKSFTFTDTLGVQQDCSDPDEDLVYECEAAAVVLP